MSEPHLLVDQRDGVMTLTMNRPEVGNALSPQMLILLARAWYEYRDSDDLRVAIFTGAGDKAFCVGGDLKITMPLMTGARQPEDEWDCELLGTPNLFLDAILRGFQLYKPIISAINGTALGGGTEMIQATDIRIAANHAIFGTPEARVGLLPGGGSLTRLARQIPYAHAMEILLTGRPFSAQRALEFGLINYVVPRDELIDKAHEIADVLAKNGPLALRKIKEGVIRTSGRPIDEALQIENEVSAAVITSNDAREGPRAFKEKRQPKFTGT
jgi:enoyl-CoA hydratase